MTVTSSIPGSRTIAFALVATVLLLAAASSAHAHGGQFIPPPGDGPPPPVLGPPPSIPGVTPPPSGPPAVTPPGVPTGPVTTPGAVARGRGSAAGGDLNASWETWWALNRLAYLPDRDAMDARRAVTPREGDDPHFGRTRRAEAARLELSPFLRGVAEPQSGARDDLVASALLALARVEAEPATVALLLRRLDDPRAAGIVRESAALALGLLRRSDAALGLPGDALDAVRDRLLAAFDDPALPARARAFCALSLGLLADQPYDEGVGRDGRLVTRALWIRLGTEQAHRDLPVALLVALGMQPPAGVPDGVRESLEEAVLGKRVHGRSWDALERGHALSARLRLGGPGAAAFLRRVLESRRADRALLRAAFLGLEALSPLLDAEERAETGRALATVVERSSDPLTRGLGLLAVGHLLAADLRLVGPGDLRERLGRLLLDGATGGESPSSGFAALGLALAVRGVEPATREDAAFLLEAKRALLAPLEKGRGSEDRRAAHAVACGLAGVEESRPLLLAVVGDRDGPATLRGHAAVALGHLGRATPEVERALGVALADARGPDLRRQAALGLALLGGRGASAPLLRELAVGETELFLAQVVVALGRLGDLAAVRPVRAVAEDEERSELARALALVALGLLGDPEPRPSLLLLVRGTYYVERTDALHEAFTIL